MKALIVSSLTVLMLRCALAFEGDALIENCKDPKEDERFEGNYKAVYTNSSEHSLSCILTLEVSKWRQDGHY